MSNYIVTDSELTSVANAIRTKGGTNGSLVFPDGFTSAISNISGGGGSSDFSIASVTLTLRGSKLYGAIACDEEDFHFLNIFIADSGTYNFVLYKGIAIAELHSQGTIINDVIVTGDIEYSEDEQGFMITGNGTITIISDDGPSE